MMKKVLPIVAAVLLLAALWFIGSGFTVNTAVCLGEFSVSEDASELILHTGIASSMGYVRTYRDVGGGVKPHYLKFYGAFGGPNGSVGAKSTYVLPLQPEDSEVYFYRGDGGYELVLQKNADGIWERTGSISYD